MFQKHTLKRKLVDTIQMIEASAMIVVACSLYGCVAMTAFPTVVAFVVASSLFDRASRRG